MKNGKSMMNAAIAGVIALGLGGAATQAYAEKMEMEKCYGVVKAGKNDCKTGTNSCQGHTTKDNDPNAFIAVPKGTCEKIAGGSMKPKG